MLPETKAAKMLDPFDGDPDADELAGDGNKLQEEPIFFKLHLLHHAPGVVKRDKCLPAFNAGFFEHAVHPDMPA